MNFEIAFCVLLWYCYLMIKHLELMDGPFDVEDSFSLVVVRNQGYIVMGRKRRGYGEDKLVLPGGKNKFYISSVGIGLVPTTHDASREVYEETGLDIDHRAITQKRLLHSEMLEDYKLWLPHLLAGYTVDGFIETDSDRVLEAKIFRQQLNPLGRMEFISTAADIKT